VQLAKFNLLDVITWPRQRSYLIGWASLYFCLVEMSRGRHGGGRWLDGADAPRSASLIGQIYITWSCSHTWWISSLLWWKRKQFTSEKRLRFSYLLPLQRLSDLGKVVPKHHAGSTTSHWALGWPRNFTVQISAGIFTSVRPSEFPIGNQRNSELGNFTNFHGNIIKNTSTL
jgi:hypothetical protein